MQIIDHGMSKNSTKEEIESKDGQVNNIIKGKELTNY